MWLLSWRRQHSGATRALTEASKRSWKRVFCGGDAVMKWCLCPLTSVRALAPLWAPLLVSARHGLAQRGRLRFAIVHKSPRETMSRKTEAGRKKAARLRLTCTGETAGKRSNCRSEETKSDGSKSGLFMFRCLDVYFMTVCLWCWNLIKSRKTRWETSSREVDLLHVDANANIWKGCEQAMKWSYVIKLQSLRDPPGAPETPSSFNMAVGHQLIFN